MMKRNEGYALSYVLIILLILVAIAAAVTGISLHNLKSQQSSIDRMEEKYVAQGLVEQVVAQLETTNGKSAEEVIDGFTFPEGCSVTFTEDYESSPAKLTISAVYNKTTVSAGLDLTEKTDTIKETVNDEETTKTVIIGYTITYTSYQTEVTS